MDLLREIFHGVVYPYCTNSCSVCQLKLFMNLVFMDYSKSDKIGVYPKLFTICEKFIFMLTSTAPESIL